VKGKAGEAGGGGGGVKDFKKNLFKITKKKFNFLGEIKYLAKKEAK
jgi:hypothetical protein